MPLTRSAIRDLLDEHDLGPSRALGQNFLCDPNMVDKIVRLAGVGDGDRVVEIGPGLGSLTLGLLEAGCRVLAIEIDRYLLPALRSVTAEYTNADSGDSAGADGNDAALRIVNADVRAVDWDHLLDGERWAVVANLPYNIATPLVLDLLAQRPDLGPWLVMVQREAGERLVAGPGSKTYGIPSVLASYWGTARLVGAVGADLFLPRPKVESVLVRIDRHSTPPVDVGFATLSTVVRTGFGQRRKMLRRSLAGLIDVEAMTDAGVDPTARPEQLDLGAWARLATLIESPGVE